MSNRIVLLLVMLMTIFSFTYTNNDRVSTEVKAADILENTNYLALSFGGYRHETRETVPSVDDLKEDLAILEAIGVKLIRTYNTSQFAQTENLLKAIKALKKEQPNFEMYVMLGAWIECQGAWSGTTVHNKEHLKNNTAEIEKAIELVNEYPDVVKFIAVGNEAMVKWAASYYVTPDIILKWVNFLQKLKEANRIPADVWITSSDNYESWGGGNSNYHTEDLKELVKAVDFISLHTYPFHDSHYNPSFWGVPEEEEGLSELQKIDAAMLRAKNYAVSQYEQTKSYLKKLGVEKPIHIGETGWATVSGGQYGETGSQAADEYKQKKYYEHMRTWSKEEGMSCFFFEAFDEKWKDAENTLGCENHFGLINLDGQAKYALWDQVDAGAFKGLTRGGKPITKTYKGNEKELLKNTMTPPLIRKMSSYDILTTNDNRAVGEVVSEENYIVAHQKMDVSNTATYPSAALKLNSWEGTCGIELTAEEIVKVTTGTGAWWGAGLEIQGNGTGENFSNFTDGVLHFEIKGNTKSTFELGFQTGSYINGTLKNNFVSFGSKGKYPISEEWTSYSINISELNAGADLKNVTGLLCFLGKNDFDGKEIEVKNIYFSKK